ncbi:MAG: hypothetical protein COA71_10020 [SAR86 cluster bacterium]|uniref:Universal stress protein n=1 Tax=SAR86 cluster bacterium TaxID=2030880 RepID=A0A2A5CC46_9GAMM|nr:MAG: hypothetical protein COA71_10020 [SAR86 cluster bacterium]
MKFEDSLHKETILVLIEPSRKTHVALNRAIIRSRLKKIKPRLHLCISISESYTAFEQKHSRSGQQDKALEMITQFVEKEGLEYICEYCDLNQKYESVLNCAERIKPDMLMLPDYEESLRISKGRHLNWGSSKQSHWPVMILGPSTCSYSEFGFEFNQAF